MAEVETSALAGGPSIVRLALTGAAVFSIIFAVYWMRSALEASVGPGVFLPIFSPAAKLTSAAFGLGFFLSILFGALAGALSALFYNLFAPRG
jgi:hypothetical protein